MFTILNILNYINICIYIYVHIHMQTLEKLPLSTSLVTYRCIIAFHLYPIYINHVNYCLCMFTCNSLL